ncbi:cytochrome c maturation protein CcmE [Marinimicrobium alkaliphilum]|uniref:cytochrome c maturation protein CcmE n=1 Tax=Marinimicrobium alkaliphilum TaxID=2202654 RepID=UPI000DBAACA4|nr:cytochrome c maturation protein CcmE [Marinimicrobium alkaliphilum]
MHPARKQRLYFVLFIVIFSTVAIGLMAYALRANLSLFYGPAQVVSGQVPFDTRIRAGGCVVPGTVARDPDSLQVGFLITDGVANLQVYYTGILPDLFGEGEAAVVNGMVREDDGAFYASEVLAKHDEQYMPPEVAEAMKAYDGGEKSCEDMNYGT